MRINPTSFWFIGILFTLLITPFSLGYLFVAPSEKFYSDGAITMIQTGDWLIPYFDNELRFYKPIISYWWVGVSFLIFGVDYWTLRLPFLLGGLITMWLTYKGSLIASSNKKEQGVIAALILATHPLLILSASRAIPDMPLVIYNTLGLVGFLGMLKFEGKKQLYTYIFYLGFSLGIAAKGVPALILGGFAGMYLLFNPFQSVNVFRVFLPISIILALLISVSWYIYIYLAEPQVFMDQFFEDQIGSRVVEEKSRLLTNILTYLFTLAYSLPWLIPVFFRWKNFKTWFKQQEKTQQSLLFLGGVWFLFFTGTAPFFLIFYDRYLFPFIPLQSIIFASILLSFPKPKVDKIMQRVVWGFYILSLLVLLTGIFLASSQALFWIGLLVNSIVLFILKKYLSEKSSFHFLLKMGIGFLAFFFNLGVVVNAIVNPSPEKQAAKFLLANYGDELKNKKVVYLENTRNTAKLRMPAYQNFEIVRSENWREVEQMDFDKLILIPEKKMNVLDSMQASFEVKEVALKYPLLHEISAFQGLGIKEQKLFLAIPKE